MPHQTNVTPQAAVSRHLRLSLALGAILIGLAVLAGWLLNVPILKTIIPGRTTMKPNTALGLIGGGLAALAMPMAGHGGASVGKLRALALCGGAIPIILGVATLVEYASGLRLGIDQALFADPHTTSPPFPGRMSPASATGLSCVGGALLLLQAATGGWMRQPAWRRRTANAAHLLAAIPAAIGYLSVTGYAYHVDKLYYLGAYIAVALHTALGLLCLSPTILLTQARLGWAQGLTGYPGARDAFRLLLPVALLFPFLAGLIVVRGARTGIYDPLFGLSLFALATAWALVAMAWIGAMVVRGAEERLRLSNARLAASELALRAANEGLEARVREEVAAREAAFARLAHGQRWRRWASSPAASPMISTTSCRQSRAAPD